MNHKAFMCACLGFPRCIWMVRILLNLIALLAWLFLVLNCVCGSLKRFYFGTQMQTTSLLPRLQAQCGSSLCTARLQSGLWRSMSRDNQGPRHNSPVVGLKLHMRTSGHLHIRLSYTPESTSKCALYLGSTSKPSTHLLSLEEGFILCWAVLLKLAGRCQFRVYM